MPWANNPEIDSLRLKYNAALTAYRSCSRALMDARIEGTIPSPELVEADANARLELEAARAKLLAAMTAAITSGTDLEPPRSQG